MGGQGKTAGRLLLPPLPLFVAVGVLASTCGIAFAGEPEPGLQENRSLTLHTPVIDEVAVLLATDGQLHVQNQSGIQPVYQGSEQTPTPYADSVQVNGLSILGQVMIFPGVIVALIGVLILASGDIFDGLGDSPPGSHHDSNVKTGIIWLSSGAGTIAVGGVLVIVGNNIGTTTTPIPNAPQPQTGFAPARIPEPRIVSFGMNF